MTQQKAGYPLDYSKGSADAGKDRLREMADVATDKVKNVTESAEEIAGKVAEQAREYGEKAQEAVKNFKRWSQMAEPLVVRIPHKLGKEEALAARETGVGQGLFQFSGARR